MDFIDDLPESTEQERFQRHNRFLRSLKSDTLLIIDNFNVTATQDSFLSVVLKYRCQILFTTRSKLDEYCTLPLKEIEDMNALFQLASVFYSEADTYRTTKRPITAGMDIPRKQCVPVMGIWTLLFRGTAKECMNHS